MPSMEDAQEILKACKLFAKETGLSSNLTANLDTLELDFVTPPHDFLGINSNPAIFVNEDTYKFLGKHHESWKFNKTIAIKEDALNKMGLMNLIGIIAHETGHAFSVAAGISNTEQHAYAFEVKILLHWHKNKAPILETISQEELMLYFENRIPYYKKGISQHPAFAKILVKITAPLTPEMTKTKIHNNTSPTQEENKLVHSSIFNPVSTKSKPITNNIGFFSTLNDQREENPTTKISLEKIS